MSNEHDNDSSDTQGSATTAARQTRPARLGNFEQKKSAVIEQLKKLLVAPSEEEAQRLIEKYSKCEPTLLSTVDDDLSVVIMVPIPEHLITRFRRNVNGSNAERAAELFFRDIVIFPDRPVIEEALKLQPLLADSFGNRALKFAGLQDGIEGKPL